MKDTSKIKKELREHIRTSSFEQIHKELIEAGLYTYANTEDVITGNEIKVSIKSEESISFEGENISYNERTKTPNNPYSYSLAS